MSDNKRSNMEAGVEDVALIVPNIAEHDTVAAFLCLLAAFVHAGLMATIAMAPDDLRVVYIVANSIAIFGWIVLAYSFYRFPVQMWDKTTTLNAVLYFVSMTIVGMPLGLFIILCTRHSCFHADPLSILFTIYAAPVCIVCVIAVGAGIATVGSNTARGL